jgi:hypothetical protein
LVDRQTVGRTASLIGADQLKAVFHLVNPVLGQVFLAGPGAAARDRLALTSGTTFDITSVMVDLSGKYMTVPAAVLHTLEAPLRAVPDGFIGPAVDDDACVGAPIRGQHFLIAVVAYSHGSLLLGYWSLRAMTAFAGDHRRK